MATQQRIFIAENYLRILRDKSARTRAEDTYYVRTAAVHGVPPERISELSGLPLNRVALLLREDE